MSPSTPPHLATLAFALGLTACGGPAVSPLPSVSPPVSPGSAGRPTAGVPPDSLPPDMWARLLAGGQRATLLGPGGEQVTVEATDARTIAGQAVVRLRWSLTDAGATTPLESPPSQVAADATTIHLLDAAMEDADVADALAAPSPLPRRAVPLPAQTRADGLYTQIWRGPSETVACYGEGPPPDAGPCEDVCFSELCVSATAGIVEVSGRWSPNAASFTAAGYADFRERLKFVAK